MKSTFDPAATPRIRPGLDLARAGLSAEEGMVAARIDGATPFKDLAHVAATTLDDLKRILDRLTQAGVVVWGDFTDNGPCPEMLDSDKPDYGRFIFAPALMTEDNDLGPDERKKIIWFHAHLDKWTYYEVLQVPRRAEPQVIKRAYFLRSKEWHSDRYCHAGKLGSFKAMLDQIFEHIKRAYGVLCNPDQRKAYDEANVLMMGDDEIAEMLDEQRREDRERRRAQEAVIRRKKKNPMRPRIRRAETLRVESMKEREGGNVLKALGLMQMAEAYDGRETHKEAVAQLKEEALELRLTPLMRRGAHHESLTHWGDAVALFEEAARIAPDHGPARVRLAFNQIRARRDPVVAVLNAQKGVQLLPDDPEAHFVLGLCYEKSGKDRAAVRELTKALELKPNYKEAKKLLRELKWGF